MFSCNDINIRKEYVKLVEDVRDAGGEVKIFSSMHISGQRKYRSFDCIFIHCLICQIFIEMFDILRYRACSTQWDSGNFTISDA